MNRKFTPKLIDQSVLDSIAASMQNPSHTVVKSVGIAKGKVTGNILDKLIDNFILIIFVLIIIGIIGYFIYSYFSKKNVFSKNNDLLLSQPTYMTQQHPPQQYPQQYPQQTNNGYHDHSSDKPCNGSCGMKERANNLEYMENENQQISDVPQNMEEMTRGSHSMPQEMTEEINGPSYGNQFYGMAITEQFTDNGMNDFMPSNASGDGYLTL